MYLAIQRQQAEPMRELLVAVVNDASIKSHVTLDIDRGDLSSHKRELVKGYLYNTEPLISYNKDYAHCSFLQQEDSLEAT